MGKLGKKARKFAKKGLQSVYRQNRKQNSQFKRKRKSPRDEPNAVRDEQQDNDTLQSERKTINQDIKDDSLDIFPYEDKDESAEECSDSDGYLSEDSSCLNAGENQKEEQLEGNGEGSSLSTQNEKLWLEVEEKRKKLEELKEKDQGFSTFLEVSRKNLEALQDDEMDSDEDDGSDHDLHAENDISRLNGARLLTSSVVNNWSQLVTEQRNLSALRSLLNAYRTACHFGAETSQAHGSVSSQRMQNSETFCCTIMFMLREADSVFRDLLGLSSTTRKIETVLGLQKNSKWKEVKPMVKSYLRSTLVLLSQITDTELLVYSLSRLRVSLILFAAFRSLLHKLTQVSVNLWATGIEALSSCSVKILDDAASLFGSDLYDDCLKKMYEAFLSCCKVTEPANLNHRRSLRDSFVDFCSIDLQKSVGLALLSTQRLAKIIQLAIPSKREDALKKIRSWEYVLSVDLWVQFASANVKENDLQGLSFSVVQVINGMSHLFSGPCYLPLKTRCIRWLNQLSSSSGMFIPVSSLVLDFLEYNTGKEGGKGGESANFPKDLKLPKYWLKSQKFQEESVAAVVELLSAHFANWSYHISFPELATVPVVRLRKFLEKSKVEGLRTGVKRLIDQVEKNIEYVQRRRNNVSFSPKDQESTNSFFQNEKSTASTPFSQYYRGVIEKAALRSATSDNKTSSEGRQQNKPKRRKRPSSKAVTASNGNSKKLRT